MDIDPIKMNELKDELADCKQKHTKLTKEKKKLNKENGNLRRHFKQVMKHHMRQRYQDQNGRLCCPVCTAVFSRQRNNQKRPVKLDCIHVVCYSCARNWASSRRQLRQVPTCPEGCNTEYNPNQLQFIQL